MKKDTVAAVALAIFLLLSSVYLLTYSGEFHSIDEVSMFAVTESFVKHGSFTTNQMLWSADWQPAQNRFGPDGNYYSKKGAAQSLVAAPLYWLGLHLPSVGLVRITMLTNGLITALTGAVVFLLLIELGFFIPESAAVSLLFGLGTMAWPYARTFFSEPLAALTLLFSFYLLARLRRCPSLVGAALAGLALGSACSARIPNVFVAPAYLGYLMYQTRDLPQQGTKRRLLVAFALTLAASLILIAAYNAARFGNPLDAGYTAQERFTAFLPRSLAGFLFSPGKSLFVYSPVLLLALFGIRAFWRRFPAETLLISWVAAVHLVVYGLWFMWWGGWSWGPRFLAPLIPFLILPLAFVPRVLRQRHKALRLGALVVVVSSIGMQVLGSTVDFNEYLADLLNRGIPAENTIFDLRFWPVAGHWALLRRGVWDLAWFTPTERGLFVLGPVVALLLGVALLAVIAMRWAAATPRRSLVAGGCGLLLLVMAASIGLRAYPSLPQHRRDPDQAALVNYVQRAARPGDAFILELIPAYNYFAHALSFMNDYRARPPYAGILRSTDSAGHPRDEEFLRTLLTARRRLWLRTEHTAPGDPASITERWFAERAYPISYRWFGDSFRLILYSLPRGDSAPLLVRTVDERWGSQIELLTAWLSVAEGDRRTEPLRVYAGDTLQLELIWRALQRPHGDWKVSVQLLDWHDRLKLQEDRKPVAGFRPTSGWSPGEVVHDRYGLPLPDNLQRGRYDLVVALYRAADGKRLLTASGDDHTLITEIVVER